MPTTESLWPALKPSNTLLSCARTATDEICTSSFSAKRTQLLKYWPPFLVFLFLLLFSSISSAQDSCPDGLNCCGNYGDHGACLGICIKPTDACHWRPTILTSGSQNTTINSECSKITHICVKARASLLPIFDHTDPETVEKWVVTLNVAGNTRTKARDAIYNQDNSFDLTSGVGICIPKESVPFYVSIRGFEDDTFFDDPIPEATLKISSVCSSALYTLPSDTDSMNVQDTTYIKKLFGVTVVKRRAQYIFSTQFMTPPVTNPGSITPNHHKCTFPTNNCCGIKLPDGSCEGTCVKRSEDCQ